MSNTLFSSFRDFIHNGKEPWKSNLTEAKYKEQILALVIPTYNTQPLYELTFPELKDTKVIKNLIEQVYQFSRMYWKSVRQQNLPVTIKYPEMVAQIAPHFNANDIPEYGKTNLWFL